jgi:MFS transporter, DHA3 family, macrolide efflux protein
MMVGDTVAVFSTIFILLLHLTNNLQIWHFYLTGAIVGTFNQFQSLAYSASVSLMIPKQHYTRASSLQFVSGYGSNIIAPALAGYLYTVVGFLGIWLIDIFTFALAISSLLFVSIPQPSPTKKNESEVNVWQDLGLGWRYIATHKSLLALLVVNLLFWLPHDIGDSLYAPMILSRTNNNTLVLGSLASAAGFGGVTGAIIVSTWGGFRWKIKGILLGMMGAGISKIVFGLGRTPWVWIPAQFCSSFNFPLNGSSDTAIWLAKVPPNVQGRVANRFCDRLFNSRAFGRSCFYTSLAIRRCSGWYSGRIIWDWHWCRDSIAICDLRVVYVVSWWAGFFCACAAGCRRHYPRP